jgi:phosphatidylethanolamine/phosphatidyl-N-methylethanolamine N-methyltransferase
VVFRFSVRDRDQNKASPVTAKTDTITDNLRFLRALIARPKNIGAVAPSSRALGRAIARQLDPSRSGPVLELGPGTGVITAEILNHGIAPERLTLIEYDSEFAQAIAARFHGVHVIQGDAFDLGRTLGARHTELFAGIVSGIPLLNFPTARRRAYVEALAERLLPGAPLIQFSYGMHAPVVPPAGHSVICAARVWANIPPARVWVYRRL